MTGKKALLLITTGKNKDYLNTAGKNFAACPQQRENT